MKMRKKLLIGVMTLGIIGGAYAVRQNVQDRDIAQNEIVKDESINQQGENTELSGESAEEIITEDTAREDEEVSVQQSEEYEEDTVVQQKLKSANSNFKDHDMINLYDSMSKREKKKWLKFINENSYFTDQEGLQYQISGLYQIGENQYYILGWSAANDGKLALAENWSESQRESYIAQDIFELILLQEGESFFVTQAIYPSVNILSSEEISLYKKAEQEASNVNIEYSKVKKLDGLEQYVDYLDEAIQNVQEETVNDMAQSEVTQYVQYAIEDLSSEQTRAEDNVIDIKEEILEQMKETVSSAKEKFDTLLSENDISFNKSLNTILRLDTQAANFKKPIYIQLPKSFENVGEVTGLRILLDEASYVYINGADLEALAGLKVKIERLKDKSTYEITFLTETDEIIEQLEQSVTFAFPAKDEFTTVVASYGEESQNWGGQYDSVASVISFGTKYTGQYQIVDNKVNIRDIEGLTSNQKSAIKFMVSKGYLTLENDYFYPNAPFTRYEFAEALVKMFFALDTSLETSFKDVPADSAYYPYVASGETYNIIKGYMDGTFKGEVNIPAEQVISLCARTIADKKGYVYPSYIEDYIKFVDAGEISKWAVNDIALAVQSGLITGGGSLAPKTEITKAESAEILYNLFMLLYETAPGNVIELTAMEKTYSILGVIIVLLLAIWLIKRFIKRNKVILTMIACTAAIIATLIIGFKGGF